MGTGAVHGKSMRAVVGAIALDQCDEFSCFRFGIMLLTNSLGTLFPHSLQFVHRLLQRILNGSDELID